MDPNLPQRRAQEQNKDPHLGDFRSAGGMDGRDTNESCLSLVPTDVAISVDLSYSNPSLTTTSWTGRGVVSLWNLVPDSTLDYSGDSAPPTPRVAGSPCDVSTKKSGVERTSGASDNGRTSSGRQPLGQLPIGPPVPQYQGAEQQGIGNLEVKLNSPPSSPRAKWLLVQGRDEEDMQLSENEDPLWDNLPPQMFLPSLPEEV